MAAPAITTARLAGFTSPLNNATTMTTSAATAIPTHNQYLLLGSGLVTWCASSGRFLRVMAYWVRPTAIPTAAAANPTWKPQFCCSQPVIRGPSRAPMLMPM